jgi:hypothetical protein
MGLSLDSLSTERQWRSSTGLNEQEFKRLSHWFGTAYKSSQEVGLDEAQSHMGKVFVFGTYSELLFFTLFSLKNPTTFDVNGLIFGISQSATEYNFRKGLELLRSALSLCGHLPRQDFKDLADFECFVRDHDCLKIDATEVAVQRPRDKAIQKARYSGKKSGTPERHS